MIVVRIYVIFHIVLHYGLLQDIECSSLSPVGPCFLSSLYITCNSWHLLTPNSQSIPPSFLLPLGNDKCVLYVCESVSQISSFMSYFRFHVVFFFLFLTSYMMSYSICLSLSDFSQYDLSPSMLLQMALFYSHLWQSGIP